MKTAIYSHHQPSNAMLDIIRRAAGEDEVITNTKLPIPYTRYIFNTEKKSSGAVWGGTIEQTKIIDMDKYPFNWMLPEAKPAGLITALAADSDRILLMFPKNKEIPPIYIFLAMIRNKTVRVYRGTDPVPVTIEDLTTPQTKKQYEQLILPTLSPIPTPKELMATPNGSKVRPYQQQMVNFSLNNPYAGWFVDMGLGKTMAALVTIDKWIKQGEIDPKKPILIVAPIMVALDTWGREVKKWGYDWDVKINVRLTPKKRGELLTSILLPQEKVTLFLTNPSQLEPIRDFYYSHNVPLPFETLIVDELSMFKAPQSKRNDAMQHFRRKAKKFLGLTGTPSPNNLLDVWNQLKVIDRENTTWAGDNIYQFQEQYFTAVARTPQGFVRKWKPKFGAENVIYRNLSRNVISMRTKGLVNLPPISHTNLYVTLPASARKEYNTLETEVAEELDSGQSASYTTDDGYTLFLPNNDVLSGKLLQIAGGALYTNTTTHQYDVFHDEKINALDGLIDSATSPLLVFYYFQSDFDRIQKKYRNNIPVLDSKDPNVQNVIEKWNDGEIPVLLAHPASVGHGLNLQDGPGHTAVWFTLPNWNNDYYQQANKRLHRSGQEHAVSVIHIIAKNTIEEVMLQSLIAKEKVNSKLMDALDTMERC